MPYTDSDLTYKRRVEPYWNCHTYRIEDDSDNISSVMTKMVQLAGRFCERYASDIYYDIRSLMHHIEDKETYDVVLDFRESGVNTHEVKLDIAREAGESIYQTWRLTYTPVNGKVVFYRVSNHAFDWFEIHAHPVVKFQYKDGSGEVTLNELEAEYQDKIDNGEIDRSILPFRTWKIHRTGKEGDLCECSPV